MIEYDISGNIVTISTEVENERFLKISTNEYIESLGERFDSWYSSQGSCYAVVQDADNAYNGSIEPLIVKRNRNFKCPGGIFLRRNVFL